MDIIIDTLELGAIDGFTIRADLVPDPESTPNELDGSLYGEEIVAAFRAGEWGYGAVVVTASRAGIELGSDSICGVEYGIMPNGNTWVRIDPLRDEGGTLDAYRDDLVGNAFAAARSKLAELVDAAIDSNIDD